MSCEIIVKLGNRLREELVETCRRRLPNEACGVVYGYRTADELIPDGFAWIRNVAPNAEEAFAFDPGEWIAACYEAQKNQRLIVGVFHSHPIGANAPSKRDEQSLVPWDSYWIIGFAGSDGDIAVYRHTEQGWVSLPLVPA
ncbi:M67 family metallopeptidase [Cohnella panacarvi]|uniref:M67 family metallopeptidase n=1 Tax=Cohnella panacarvi TaxID=400776 RepID=UPI00047A4987|nr:M67 family metallopeptidase [Cohnella panacarvi]